MENWDVAKSAAVYGINTWGEGYFELNDQGEVVVCPEKNGNIIRLPELIKSLTHRGIAVPVLIRFDGIIRDRIKRINGAFGSAIKESNYRGTYRQVFPIKVNQQRHVVDTIRQAGREYGLGLEVGSKPELIAVLAIHDAPQALLLCNGYKDREFIELALMSKKLGRRPIIIIEQLNEVDQIIEVANNLGIEAEVGLRMKPLSRGAGRWESSGGEHAKFGLSAPEIMTAIERLKAAGKSDWLKLVHFHIGSQITSIAAVKKVLREATRVYVEIKKLCPSLCFMDAGGGLAVDYDGSRTNFSSSMDYTIEEYARDIVYAIGEACDHAEVEHPDIITESGRAVVAHHSLLVVQVIDHAPSAEVVPHLEPPPTDHEKLCEYRELYEKLTVKNALETLHDVLSLREIINSEFLLGNISLAERAYGDNCFWHLMAKLSRVSAGMKYRPEDLEKLSEELRDTFFCNFSVFQSLPDAWAIDQLFPIMPIHRLKEEPNRQGILADMSCDSDGKIDRFIDLKDVNASVRLHSLKPNEPYYLGIFLVGAYQEILGDLHNLFGDTNAVHVDIGPGGEIELTHVVEGDTIREALEYVQYKPQDLLERLRLSVERAVRDGHLLPEESAKLQRRYREGLEGYTYLYVDP